MRKWTVVGMLGFLVAVLMLVSQVTARAAWKQKVDSWVLETAVSDQPTEFLIVLSEQANLSDVAQLTDKQSKGQVVYERLTAVALRSQAPVVALLEAKGVVYRRYWVSNMIWAQSDITLVSEMAKRADVARIHANPKVQLDAVGGISEEIRQTAVAAPEWNIAQINAPDVWAAGVTGEGVVIGGQDTGYDWTHPALHLHYRGWDGTTAKHNYNWHDAIHEDNPGTSPGNFCGYDLLQPCDDRGHGTHTMGTMVGDDGMGNQVGVAPGAKWIGCRNMEDGWGTPATYSECFEWFIAPYPLGGDSFSDGDPTQAPHVINNSWGCPTWEGCTDPDILRTVVNNVRAAGIVTVNSAGNPGPQCSGVNSPAAIYDASFTVGATDSGDNIAGFSARGPVQVGDNASAKPDISAPGVGIRSSTRGGGYGNSQGTSMAAPHIAGVTALLIAANPTLAGDVDLLEQMMMETAVPRTTLEGCGGDGPNDVPNHVYGWGRIDAWAAYEAVISQLPSQFQFLPFLQSE